MDEIADFLRSKAAELEGLISNRFRLPASQISLSDALETLRVGINRGGCLKMKIWWGDDGRVYQTEWSAWDGKEHHKAPTLHEAVKLALTPTPPPVDEEAALADAARVIDEAGF